MKFGFHETFISFVCVIDIARTVEISTKFESSHRTRKFMLLLLFFAVWRVRAYFETEYKLK